MSYLEFITYLMVFVAIGSILGWYFSQLVSSFKKSRLYYQATPKLLKKYIIKDEKI